MRREEVDRQQLGLRAYGVQLPGQRLGRLVAGGQEAQAAGLGRGDHERRGSGTAGHRRGQDREADAEVVESAHASHDAAPVHA